MHSKAIAYSIALSIAFCSQKKILIGVALGSYSKPQVAKAEFATAKLAKAKLDKANTGIV